MEINLNCDLGEKSIHYDGRNDNDLIKIINSANIACGYHAGNKDIIEATIRKAKENNVSIGAHPGFNDLLNFGRKKKYLSKNELIKLVKDQLNIINEIAIKNNYLLSHVKPHGALNNMACENLEIALTIGQSIKEFNKDLIYVVLPLNKMEEAAKILNIRYACEIFADRNYEDDGQLISRTKENAIIKDPIIAANNVMEMLNNSSIKCFSGKRIKCDIDTICIHGDEKNAKKMAIEIKKKIIKSGFQLKSLTNLNKFL